MVQAIFRASELPSTVDVIVGAGGIGGSGRTTVGPGCTSEYIGGFSTFGYLITAFGGKNGAGGTTNTLNGVGGAGALRVTSVAGGSVFDYIAFPGGNGAGGYSTFSNIPTAEIRLYGTTGGAQGCPISNIGGSATAIGGGGAGGSIRGFNNTDSNVLRVFDTDLVGGQGGSTPYSNRDGQDGLYYDGHGTTIGLGGGGGSACGRNANGTNTANGGNGGKGGNYGGGGGGGGPAEAGGGRFSGFGGDGGDGIVIVITEGA
jgi:hypothetical protein